MSPTIMRSAILSGLMLACGLLSGTAEAAAPAKFSVQFETTKGNFTIAVDRNLAPTGADRFHDLVKQGFFTDVAFFRVVPNFVVQFGINGNPEVQKNWTDATIQDDPVKASNLMGTITYAAAQAPNSRTTQVFINLGNNTFLDKLGFAPFGKVTQGMNVVKALNGEYGERPTATQPQIQQYGNTFLKQKFPKLDYIKKATIVP